MTALNVEEVANGIVVIRCSGILDMNHNADRLLREKVYAHLDRGSRFFLVNLENATDADSSFIGELVSVYTSVKNLGGKFKLLKLSQKIRDILSITQLISVFEVFEDREKALRSFQE